MSALDEEVGNPPYFMTNGLMLTSDPISVLRDVRERGRDIEGIIKQWFAYVKPSYTRYVEPQRTISGLHSDQKIKPVVFGLICGLDIIIPRGIENTTAIGELNFPEFLLLSL